MGGFVGVDVKISDILATDSDDESSETRANLGFADGTSQAQGVGSNTPVWSQFGFTSRVADPDENGAAMALSVQLGDQHRVFATRDMRSHGKLPQLKPGESMQFGAAGQFVRCHQDGSLSLYTTDDGTPNGRSIHLHMSPTDGFEMACPWGRFTMGPMGIHLVHYAGGRLDIGALAGLPGILSALDSYATLTASMANVSGNIVSLGSDGGAANALAVQGLLTFLAALMSAIGTITISTPGATAMAPMAAALTTLTTALQGLGKTV